MDSKLREAVAAVLREAAAPLNTRESVARLPQPVPQVGLSQIGAAAREHPLCMSLQRGLSIYLPAVVTGAAVFLPQMPRSDARPVQLPVEATRLLWPGSLWWQPATVRPAAAAGQPGRSHRTSDRERRSPPAPAGGQRTHAPVRSGRAARSAAASLKSASTASRTSGRSSSASSASRRSAGMR